MTVWLAGSGVVGSRVERLLDASTVRTFSLRRDPLPPVGDGDIAVLASGGSHGSIAAELIARGVHVISGSDDSNDVADLIDLNNEATRRGVSVVVGASFSPGLSGLLARYLAEQFATIDEIHVATHGTAGPACARVHHRSLSGRAPGFVDGEWEDFHGGAGRELCWFPEPIGALDCYRAESAVPMLLHQSFPEVRRISSRRSATRRDRLTARLPMLSPPHAEGGVGALRVEVRGAARSGARETTVLGVAELVGSAAAAVMAAYVAECAARRLPPGVVLTSDANVDFLRLLERVQHAGVRIQEFTGMN